MDQRISELLSRLVEVDDAQLGDLEEILVEQLGAAAETKDVDTARSLAEAIDKTRAERVQRARLAQEREREIAEIMSRVHAETEIPEPEGDGDGSGTDPDADDDTDADTDKDGDKEAVTAGGVRPLPKIGDLIRNRNARSASSSTRNTRSPDRMAGTTIVVAASDVPGIPAGQEIPDRVSLRKAMTERWSAVSGSRTSGRIPVARMQMNYPEDRLLRPGDEEGNWEKIQKFLSPQALLASGGICAPPAGFYDTNTLATAVRPLRDSLPVFGAERGGIRFIPSISIADVVGSVGVTTEAQDVSGATKPCLVITCESIQECTVHAVSRCLQFGNFNARTHPEYVSHISDLTVAAHARLAEQQVWEAMCDASTPVTAGENLSAWRDLYATVGRAAAMFRSRHRMPLEAVLRLAAPGWLATMLSIDLVRQAPGDNTVFGQARSAFEAGLRNINVSVTWTLEGGSDAPTQVFGAQGGGPLDGWPDAVEMLLYPEGAFLFLDGGSLDLGIVRDSTLNVSNDFQTFAETFESACFMGPEAYCLTTDICASGAAAALVETAIDCGGTVSS